MRQNGLHFCAWKLVHFESSSIVIHSQGSSQQYGSIGPDNGLKMNSLQALSERLVVWSTGLYASLGIVDSIDMWLC